MDKINFKQELEKLINQYSMENKSDTPDFILAEYLVMSLKTFDMAVKARETWYGRIKSPVSIDQYTCSTTPLTNIDDNRIL